MLLENIINQSFKKLPEIPTAILLNPNLVELNLSGNKIKDIPDELYNLENLEVLNLSSNKIKQFSSKIKNLKKLRVLKLADNPIVELPVELGELTDLETLDLNFLKLKTIPDQVARLPKIASWNFNGICKIPPTLCHPGITRLSLMGENLMALPENIGDMSDLEEFIVNSSSISNLPESISRLANLKYLDLSQNLNLAQIPPSIGHLASLEKLICCFGCLVDLPAQIGILNKLKVLRISSAKLPVEMSNLKSLEELNIDSHSQRLEFDILNLENLKSLSIYSVNMDGNIQQFLSGFQNLEKLQISKCTNLSSLDLSSFKKLKELILSQNDELVDLDFEPDSKCLERIEIVNSKFTQLDTLAKLPNLTYLRLAYNHNLAHFAVSSGILENSAKIDLTDLPQIQCLPQALYSLDVEKLSFDAKKLLDKCKADAVDPTAQSIVKTLLDLMDAATKDYLFPVWFAADGNGEITGKMRVTALKDKNHHFLIFEGIEFKPSAQAIVNNVFLFGSKFIQDTLQVGDGIYLETDPEFDLNQELTFQIRDQNFSLKIPTDFIDQVNRLESPTAEKCPEAAIALFYLCQTVPDELLFCSESRLREMTGAGGDCKILFSLTDWKHLTPADYFENDVLPSQEPGIQKLVQCLVHDATPKFTEVNTTWRYFWK